MSTIITQNAENTNNNISIIKNRIKNLINKYILNNLIVTEELVEKIKSDRILKNITIVEISSRLNEAKEDDKILYLKLGIQIDSSYFIKEIINHYNNNKNLTIISILIKSYIFNNYEDNKEVLLKIVSFYNDKDFINKLQKYLHNLISSELANETIRQKYVNLAIYILPKLFLNEIIQDYINNKDEQLLSDRLELFDWNDDINLNILLDYIKSYRDIPIKVVDILKKSNKKKETQYILSQNKGRLKREYYYFEFGVLLKNKTKKINNYKVNDSNINSKNLDRQVNSISETNYDLLSYEELPLAEFEQTDESISENTNSLVDNTEIVKIEKLSITELKKVLGKLIGKMIGNYLQEKNDNIKDNIITKIKSYNNYILVTRPAILSHLQQLKNSAYKKHKYLELGLKIDKDYFENWMKKEKENLFNFIYQIKLNKDETIYSIVQKYNFEYEETLKIIRNRQLTK